MIGIADAKLLNLRMVFCRNGMALLFIYFFLFIVKAKKLHIVTILELAYLCFTPRNSSSARLGQNSRASTSISSIAKMRSSSLICLLALIVVYRENR